MLSRRTVAVLGFESDLLRMRCALARGLVGAPKGFARHLLLRLKRVVEASGELGDLIAVLGSVLSEGLYSEGSGARVIRVDSPRACEGCWVEVAVELDYGKCAEGSCLETPWSCVEKGAAIASKLNALLLEALAMRGEALRSATEVLTASLPTPSGIWVASSSTQPSSRCSQQRTSLPTPRSLERKPANTPTY